MANGTTAAQRLRAAGVVFAACCIWLTFGSGAVLPQTPQQKAWEVLQVGLNEHNTTRRAAAARNGNFACRGR